MNTNYQLKYISSEWHWHRVTKSLSPLQPPQNSLWTSISESLLISTLIKPSPASYLCARLRLFSANPPGRSLGSEAGWGRSQKAIKPPTSRSYKVTSLENNTTARIANQSSEKNKAQRPIHTVRPLHAEAILIKMRQVMASQCTFL